MKVVFVGLISKHLIIAVYDFSFCFISIPHMLLFSNHVVRVAVNNFSVAMSACMLLNTMSVMQLVLYV